jgi:predicted outer membrane protein
MKPDPRRTLWSLAVAGAVLIAVPAPGYAQDIASSLTPPPFVVQQDDGENDNVGGMEEGSGSGGVLNLPDTRFFLRSAVTGNATDYEAARLAMERSDDPAVKQFAALVMQQSERMLQEAAELAARNGVETPQVPMAADETALIADLKTLSGREFDETYLRAFIQDHRATIAEYMAARQNMTDDAAVYADRHLGLLWDQLRSATELAMRLGVTIEER